MALSCRVIGKSTCVLLTVLALTSCEKPKAVEGKETSVSESPAQAKPPGLVVLGKDAPELRAMKIEPVHEVSVPAAEVTAPAKIEVNPNRVGHAVLPVPGRIVHVMVKLGDSVTRGQPLLSIESTAVAEAEAALVQTEASVRQAQLAIAKADADLSRLSDLFGHQAVAQKDVLAAETTLALAKASLEQAHSARQQALRRLELLGLKPGRSQQHVTVTAPLSGKVLEVSVVDGEYRNEINTALVTIADLSRVWATSEVPESKIRHCKVGGIAELELIAYPKEIFRARVTRIADTVNSETRTIKVNAELENAGSRLRPEMFGTVHYADTLVPTPWVPSGAVVRINDKDYVFVEQSPGRFLSAPVEFGKPYGGGFSVIKGLNAGDRVVTEGSVYLKAAL